VDNEREVQQENKTVRRHLHRVPSNDPAMYAYLCDEYNRLLDVIEREKLPFRFIDCSMGVVDDKPFIRNWLYFDADLLPANFQEAFPLGEGPSHPPKEDKPGTVIGPLGTAQKPSSR
jgi:hypothetical protein